jgi:hypothetical protein
MQPFEGVVHCSVAAVGHYNGHTLAVTDVMPLLVHAGAALQLALEQQRIPGLMCHGADPARKLMQACVNLYKVHKHTHTMYMHTASLLLAAVRCVPRGSAELRHRTSRKYQALRNTRRFDASCHEHRCCCATRKCVIAAGAVSADYVVLCTGVYCDLSL